MESPTSASVFKYIFTVPQDSIDENGHVNNVFYVQWMQDIAISHFESLGGPQVISSMGATWVVRSHHVEYLAPAFIGDQIEAHTWIVNVHRVRSLRRYEFIRVTDGKLLVKGETDWVFVSAHNGRTLAIPPQVAGLMPLLDK